VCWILCKKDCCELNFVSAEKLFASWQKKLKISFVAI
jgi:hypothetical protein